MGLFKSRQRKELEAELKFRQGAARISQFVAQSREIQKKYWGLAKHAWRLNDERQFRHLATAYLRAEEQGNRWERYLLQLEALGLQRNEIRATGEFLTSMKAMTNSMLRGASPEQVLKMQGEVQLALEKAQGLEQAMTLAMQVTSDSVFSADGLSDGKLKEIESLMSQEAVQDERRAGDELDSRIDEGIKAVREQMQRENSK